MSDIKKITPRLKFSGPPINKLVILHADDGWIRRLVIDGVPATTLGLYPDRYCLYVTPKIVLKVLSRVYLIKWSFFLQSRPLKELVRQLYELYILACLDCINAKVVITFIDNSGFFHRLSKMDNARVYFAIQNGARTLACVRDALKQSNPSAKISLTNFFCFGARDVMLFKEHGHLIDCFYPVGSLVGGYFKSVISDGLAPILYDICLVSQWHKHFYSGIEGDSFHWQAAKRTRAGIDALNNFLSRLISENNLTILICTRSDDADERRFYESIFGKAAIFARSDRSNFSTYRAIESAELTIGLNSTTLSEVFSWGKKVLWCNVLGDEHFEMPEAGISYYCNDSYNAFKMHIIKLLTMPQDTYIELTKKKAGFINNFDPNNPPHKIIRSLIVNKL